MRISDWSSDVCSSDLLNDIFAAAGFSRVSADVQAVGIGVANLVATVIGMSLIDRVGRKPLLMVGSGGTGIALAGVSTIYSTWTGQTLLLPALIGFILFFAISQGALIWVYLSELFPTAVRPSGQSPGRDRKSTSMNYSHSC